MVSWDHWTFSCHIQTLFNDCQSQTGLLLIWKVTSIYDEVFASIDIPVNNAQRGLLSGLGGNVNQYHANILPWLVVILYHAAGGLATVTPGQGVYDKNVLAGWNHSIMTILFFAGPLLVIFTLKVTIFHRFTVPDSKDFETTKS